MIRRKRGLVVASVVVLLVAGGAVARNQLKVQRNRDAPANDAALRQALFEALRPVALTNCQLERFGEPRDGGYLMCGNLLEAVESAYSYGIAGYDKWGCDASTKLKVPLHQYDCFDTTQPACPGGNAIFHAECVGDSQTVVDNRPFDTVENQLIKNGDGAKRVVMKMDVEGAEWASLLAAPETVLRRIDQLAIELHWLRDSQGVWTHDPRYLALVTRLKEHFHVVHLHFNNHACVQGLEPFPAWAFEVLFVSKRLGVVDPSRAGGGVHPLDAPSSAEVGDCQP